MRYKLQGGSKYNDDPKPGGRLTDHGWGGLEEHRLAVVREVAAVAQEVGATPSQVARSWVRQRAATSCRSSAPARPASSRTTWAA